MSDWLSWEELSKELQKRDFELLELFPKGLQPYKPKGREKIYCPSEHHRYFRASSLRLDKIGPEIIRQRSLENPDKQKIKELEKLKLHLEKEMINISGRDSKVKEDHERLSWEFFNLPNTEKGIEKLIHDLDLENAIFKRDNVERVKRTFGLGDLKKIRDKISERSEKFKAVFACEPGTKWEDVKITLIENDVVRIDTPRGSRSYSYHELGMADERTREKSTSMLWELLKLFAENQGRITSKNPKYDPRLPDTAKRLNKHLQKIFGINDSIFTAHYKVKKEYKTKIIFSDRTQPD